MPQIRKILFPVDFSESSLGASRYVEAIAGRFEAEIMLLHVVAPGERTLAEELLPLGKKEPDAFLTDELNYFTTHRVCEIAEDAAPAIVDEAKAWEADMVMMPTHGLGFFRRHLLGSVTAKVLHDLDCPLWTSAHAETAPPLEKIHLRRILCAASLDPCSRKVLQWANWLAYQCDATLGIVYATVAIDPSAAAWSLEKEFYHQVSVDAARRIAELQAKAGTNTPEVIIAAGKPDEVIAKAAEDFNADLVVIGRHSGGGIAGRMFHSAYAILRESPCPVVSI
jgi:nucleotide-binding universal stress UspA family protein